MYVYCENKLAVSIAHNRVQHDGAKYIEVGKHFIKEKIDGECTCICRLALSLQMC